MWPLVLGALLVIALWLALRPGRKGVKQPMKLTAEGRFAIDVVGESQFQAALSRLAGGRTREGVQVDLPATVQAVDLDSPRPRVEVRLQGELVGWLDDEAGHELMAALRKAGRLREQVHTRGLIVGGWDRGRSDKGFFGVRLDLPAAD